MRSAARSKARTHLVVRAAITEHDLVPGGDRGAPRPAACGLPYRALARHGHGGRGLFLLRGRAGLRGRGRPGPLGLTALVGVGGRRAEPAADGRDGGPCRGTRAGCWQGQLGVGQAQPRGGVVGRRDMTAVRVEEPLG